MNQQRGFSFIELLVVIALVGILGAMSVTFYGNFFNQTAVNNTIDGLVNQMRKAQTYAMESRQGGRWGIRNSGTQIILFQGTSYATRDTAYDETFSIFPTASVSAFSDIIFFRKVGTPSATPTITVTSGTITKTVTVNSVGVISR